MGQIIIIIGTSIADPLLQSFERIAVKDATLLGAALFHGPVLDSTWAERCDDLARAVDRLSVIGSQNALHLECTIFSGVRLR